MTRDLDNEAFARHAQTALAARGFDPGAADGWAGPRTRAAFDAMLAAAAVGAVPIRQATDDSRPAATLLFPQVARPLREIILHCTATRPEWMDGRQTADKVAEVRRWHKARGWRDIGYHFLIDRNGTIASGRPLGETGAHTIGRNSGTIGVALIGGHGAAATDKFEQHFTGAQDVALRQLIAALNAQFGPLAISGHNQWAAKACPGFNVSEWERKL